MSSSRQLGSTSLTSVVSQLAELVREHYVFPDVGADISRRLEEARDDGSFNRLDPPVFAARITEQMQATSADAHLRLVFHPDELVDEVDEARERLEMTRWAAESSSGVAQVRRSNGIGVLQLAPILFPPSIAAEAVGAAFSRLGDTTALVLDLRECVGGDPEMVAFAASYLFDTDAVHINDIVERGGETRQFWTLPYVPGDRFGADKPVYVLTSVRTFSGGEAFAYDLQQLGRAVIVGETTRGGANPRRGFRLSPHLEAHVPVARAVNPRSGTNWEVCGVAPDIAVPGDQALDVAMRLARESAALR